MSSAREKILNRLKNAVHPEPEKPDFDAPVYFSIDQPLELAFKENLEKVNGSVHLYNTKEAMFSALHNFLSTFTGENIICNEKTLQEKFKENGIPYSSSVVLPKTIEVGITSCEFLIAHTGSVMVSSALGGSRQLSVYPPVHVVVADKSQIVDYLGAAYTNIQNKYGRNLPSQITLITGPSRTADIEKTLVMGAHGPREFHVFIS